jgi:hypothetical protein
VAQKYGYQHRDHHIVDYQMFSLLPRLDVRGPKPPLDPGSFFACLGAAQTFGRFCERPFPTILSEELDLPVLNLGAAGAGPLFFVRRPRLLEYVNRARFAIVQVMSARSEDNSVFESLGTGLMTRRSDGKQLIADVAYQELLDSQGEEFVRQIVEETRQAWVHRYRGLFARLEVPTILFWFSERTPEYTEDYAGVDQLFGPFPQLVNPAMMDEIIPLADGYVECVTSRGLPQPLFDRVTGERTTMVDIPPGLGGRTHTHNAYYPSPEMQADAAAVLLDAAKSMLERTAVEQHESRPS